MNVRVCGPNLNSAAQRKATFHVHAASCDDLSKYGPGRPYGGDVNGDSETLMNVDDSYELVTEVYGDQIDEQPESEKKEYINNLFSDFWFAPCTKGLA